MSATFRAFMVNKTPERFTAQVQELSQADLPAGEVLIRVAYSSVNYKDALACIPDGKVVRSYPLVPGIDLSGVVVESSDPRFQAGDEVIVTSYDLGVSHYGGYSEYARVPAAWVVPLPPGLTLKEAMALGTAGIEAGLAVHQLEKNGLTPQRGPVLVTGATGGVGRKQPSPGEGAMGRQCRFGGRHYTGLSDPHRQVWWLNRGLWSHGWYGGQHHGNSIHPAGRESAGDRLGLLPDGVAP